MPPGQRRKRARLALRAFVVVAAFATLSGSGCGTPGNPSAPSLALPTPVTDLAASRTAGTVHLTWTMPRRTTDKLPIRQQVTVHICRQLEGAPCMAVGDPQFEAGQLAPAMAQFDDKLPQELTTGPARLLIYTVEARNRAGRAAGISNPAFTAVGEAPAPMTGFTAQVRADGVVLGWHPAVQSGDDLTAVIIHRTLTGKAPAGKSQKAVLSTGSAPPAEETLRVAINGVDPGKALDRTAAFDQTYTYRAERVATANLSGHEIRLSGSPGELLTVPTTDVFPPRVPEGLAAVPDPAGKAIDLSWTPDTEPDLAGYVVYRRDAESTAAPLRISPAAPVVGPSFRDVTVTAGHGYAYSVSAVDQHGNESARSGEQQETLPQP